MNLIQKQIHTKLSEGFQPVHLDVVNESYMHSVPAGSETHFKVTLVTSVFEGKRQIQRHQAVYACLASELKGGVHALALHTFSPDEWLLNNQGPLSPQCLGGSKHDE